MIIITQSRRCTSLLESISLNVQRNMKHTLHIFNHYLHNRDTIGSVGTGKSALMNYFFKSVTLPSDKKRRVHFHDFMKELHLNVHTLKARQVHERKQGGDAYVGSLRGRVNEGDALLQVAEQMSKDTWLLCFDEFQVVDVADAFNLHRFFNVLWQNGTVVVATSNRPPEELYLDGLNREYFLPFIDLLKRWCKVIDMHSNKDYRLTGVVSVSKKVYFYPSKMYDSILNSFFSPAVPLEIDVSFGRRSQVQYDQQHQSCKMSFDELCKKDLGAHDYGVLARRFPSIIVYGIPVFKPSMHNEARRFVTFIDQVQRICYSCVVNVLYPPPPSPLI
jgi:predicted ATPase